MARNLANWLRAYMEFTRETESPDAYHFWVGCSLISAATKRQVCLDFKQFKIFPNTYIILVGPAGARKSVAAGIGINIAMKSGLKKFSDKITGAALIKDLSENAESFTDVQKGMVYSCTPMIIYASELGVFMGSDAYGSGVIADLTDLFDCPSVWEKKTIARDVESITAPYITVLAASTPQTLKDVIPPGAVGQGFTSRILFVWAPGRRKRVPVPSWGVEYEMLQANLVADLKHISTLRGTFSFSAEGLQTYTKHYMEHPEPEEEFEDERLRNYASRKDIHMLKIAQILSLADRDDLVIGTKEVVAAIEALKWLDQGLPQVFAGHGEATGSESVIRIFTQVDVATRTHGYISHSDIVKRNFHALGPNELNQVLETLKGAGAITEAVIHDKDKSQYVKIWKCVDPGFIKKARQNMPRNFKDV